MRTDQRTPWLTLPLTALLAGLIGLPACGGGGSSGSGTNTVVDGPVTGLPPGGGGLPPVGGGGSGGGTPPPDAPPPDLPPPDDGGGSTVPGPAPGPVVLASLPGVRALATDAGAGVVYAVDADGILWRHQLGEEHAMHLYGLGVNEVEGLTYARGPEMLYLSLQGRYLASFDLDTQVLRPVGVFGAAYTSVRALEWDGQAPALYGVDQLTRTLLRIDLLTGLATALAVLPAPYAQVEALALDPIEQRLYAADLATRTLIEIVRPGGAVIERAELPRPEVAGLGYVVPGDRFVISDPGTGEILLWDAKGVDIDLFSMRGLDYDAAGRRVLGVHQGQSMLVAIDPVTGWKRWLGWIGVAGVESLAVDAPGRVAYGLDNRTKRLVRISLATGEGTVVGTLSGAVAGGADIAGLTFDALAGALYAADAATGALLRIDPATAAVTLLGSLPQAGVRGLAFDPVARRLHAVSSLTQMHMVVDPATFAMEVQPVTGVGVVQGLAFDPQRKVLWGTVEGVANLVPVWAAPAPATVGFDDVRALTWVGTQLVGYDVATAQLVRIDPETGTGAAQASLPAFDLEALAWDATAERLYASDARSLRLLRMDAAGGSLERVGTVSPGDIRGLAFDNGGVLYGVDRTARTLVAIHPQTGVPIVRANLAAAGLTDLQGLAWDDHTRRLVAVDAAQRRLVAIDPAAGYSVEEIGIMVLEDVRALVVEGPGVLRVLDRVTDRLYRVNRFTGAVLE